MYEPQFRCRSNGVPILSHEDIESDAEMFIRDFDPDVLNNPKEVNIEEFAEFYLGLTPEYNNLTHCGLILGRMVFNDVTGVSLLLRREFGGTEQALPLSPSGDGRWQAVYTAPAEPDLVWYAFQFTYSDCVRPYGPHGFDDSSRWQLTMQPNDRKAIAELTELARILSGMEQIRKDKKEANLKIEFVTRKMQEQEEEK